jgi:hypothetical protein
VNNGFFMILNDAVSFATAYFVDLMFFKNV